MVTVEEKIKYGIPTDRIETISIIQNDPDWKHWINKQFWSSEKLADKMFFVKETHKNDKVHADMFHLHEILLEIGGEETCFPCLEEDLSKILERGHYYPGKSKMKRGKPSQCHQNAANLWDRNHEDKDVHIATGYALSADGLWRQHSWLVHRYETKTQHRMRIIETTTKRVAYFGYEMDDKEAQNFVYDNFL